MSNDKSPPYGTTVSRPDDKAGVEVGGGDKAAAAISKRAREEGRPGPSPDREKERAEKQKSK